MLRPTLAMLYPATWKPVIQATRTLWFAYGHVRTVLTNACVDAADNPIPWYTFPAIEYIKQLDFSDARVFEYGAGHSTMFWATIAREVVSVEDDQAWYENLKARMPANCTLQLETDLVRYIDTLSRFPEGFDVIVVDGASRGSTRLKCVAEAIRNLRPGGMIILDNSDWLPESARKLREADLIQVDMAGFIPIGGNTQTTSFFFHRQFRRQPRGDRQPQPSPGAVPKVWEHRPSMKQPVVEIDGEVFGGVTVNEEFRLATPDGPREFSLIVAEESPDGPGCTAIVDRRDKRVLISATTPPDQAIIGREFRAALAKPWDEFCEYVDRHDKKRYRLRPHSASE